MHDETETLRSIRLKLNLTQEELAKKLDLSKQYISLVEKGIKKLSKEKKEKLKELYFAYDTSITKIIEVDYFPKDFPISATDTYIESPTKIKLSANLFKDYTTQDKFCVFPFYEESMTPTIQKGDYLILKYYNHENISDNRIYTFFYNNELFTRRISKNINQLIITSDNPKYEKIILSEEEKKSLQIIGKIIGTLYC